MKKNTFNKGDIVPEDSTYICVPCGYKQKMKKGDIFGECMGCLAGTKQGSEEYAEGLELWEKFEEK